MKCTHVVFRQEQSNGTATITRQALCENLNDAQIVQSAFQVNDPNGAYFIWDVEKQDVNYLIRDRR